MCGCTAEPLGPLVHQTQGSQQLPAGAVFGLHQFYMAWQLLGAQAMLGAVVCLMALHASLRCPPLSWPDPVLAAGAAVLHALLRFILWLFTLSSAFLLLIALYAWAARH